MGRTRVVLLAFVVALVCGLWSAAAARAQEPGTLENVLVFSKTGGFRHDSIPQGIAAIQQLGAANGFTVSATEDAAQFTDANLANYDVVVFLSTTGEVLDDAQQAAFERFIQAGGGYAGIHAASDTEYSWPWYGELVGGYFRTHPPGTPTATVEIEDADEPSTTGLPASWTRVDEWYNFQHPTTPAVNGSSTIADFSPRARHVKVLATVDESTYGEEDGNTADDDHPVAWCSRFDGGISWYTAMGHTQASFAEPEVPRPPARRPAHGRGRRRRLRRAALDAADRGRLREGHARQRDQGADGDRDRRGRPRVLHRARPAGHRRPGQPGQRRADGRDPDTQAPSVAGTLTVDNSHENGLLGVTLAPDFAVTGHLYMSYSKLGVEPVTAKVNRLSRFTIGADNQIVAGSEVPIYEWTHQREECCHTGGSLDFGARRQHLHLHGRQHEPVRATATTRPTSGPAAELGRAAHVGEHEQPERQDPPDRPARGAARPARRGHDLHIPTATCSRPAPPRRCPRSTRWASATRSGSTVDPVIELGLHGRLRP